MILTSTLSLFCSHLFAVEILDMISPEQLQRIREVKTIETIGKLELGGLTGTIETIYSTPGKIYTTIDLGMIKMTQAYDGKSAWVKDQNDQLLELTGLEKRNLVSNVYIVGLCYFTSEGVPGKVEFVKDTMVDSQSYHVFSAVPTDGDSLWLFFNKDNRRLEILKERMDEIVAYSYYSDFREMEGIMMPFVTITKASIPQFNTSQVNAEVRFNIAVDDSIFGIGTNDSSDYHFPADADSILVPFYFYGGHMIIDAEVNGKSKVSFILDSGAGSNVIDKTYAAELELKNTGEISAKGIAGYGTATFAEIDSLVVGSIRLLDQVVGIIDLAGIGLRYEGKLGGILGYDLLSKFPMRVDYAAGRLIFHNPDKFIPPDPGSGIDFELLMKVPLVRAIYDSIPGRFLVDFGNPLGLILHKSFVDKHKLVVTFTDIKEIRGGIGGVGGLSDAYAATGSVFRIGSLELKRLPLMVVGGEGGLVKSSEADGNIGNLLLKDFSIVMDYGKKKIYIAPLKK